MSDSPGGDPGWTAPFSARDPGPSSLASEPAAGASPMAGPPPAYGSAPHGQAPYGPPPAYGSAPYGQAPYGQATYGWAAEPPRAARPPDTTIALTIVSGLLTVTCLFLFSLPSLVLGIVALTRARTDPESCRKLTQIGWIVLGVVLAVILLAGVGVLIFSLESPDALSTPDPSSI